MKNAQNSYIDRDLSWLDFNTRVLELAENQKLPLLERVKFLAIYSSNLDEFFMVRVASLKRKIEYGNNELLISGLTPTELLAAIHNKVRILQDRVSYLLINDLKPRLTEQGITRVSWDSLSEAEKVPLTERFVREIFPVLTPLASDPSHPFPHISGLSLNLGIIGRNNVDGEEQFVRVKVPSNVSRMVRTNDTDFSYILLEDLIAEHLHLLLPGATIEEIYFFRVTRNQDLDIDEDDAEDLLESLEEELSRRKFGAAVRMEVEQGVAPRLLEKLTEELEIESHEVFIHKPPLDLTFLFEMASLALPDLKDTPLRSVQPHRLEEIDRHDADAFFAAIREGEILLHHPYQTFTSTVVRLVELAAQDPKVLAIKQTLYRTSGDSPIMKSLIEAAKAGKQVLAVIELRARFDEQANVRWAKKLEDAGAHVVYGVMGLKTHAKASLVVRKEDHGLTVYSHIGTGNYNPKTARFYEDYGILTSREAVGEDLTKLFNQLSGYAPEATFKTLLVSPNGVREGLTERIEREIAFKQEGKPAHISLKMNSLVDEQIIDSLYRASNAGVTVDVLVRGMCALKPGVPGLSENIRVRSVLGRYLEHSRIFSFAGGGDPAVFIGSADMMHRNLDRRVEALVRLSQPDHIREMKALFELAMSDEAATWHLGSDGAWTRHQYGADGKPLIDVQDKTMADVYSKRNSRTA